MRTMFSSHKAGELILILDVQSSIVRGTLAYMHKDANPTVLYTHNVTIPYKTRAHSGYLIKMVGQAINEILTDALKYLHTQSLVLAEEIPRKISAIHYVLSSPWIVSQAKTLRLSFKEDTPISSAYIMNMVQEERSKLGRDRDDIRVVEEKVFDVRLNGYSVTSWESKHTRELEVSFVVSVAGGRMIDKFIELCDHIVHRVAIHFHSSLFLQHIGIVRVMPNFANYTLIHIHGELTDVAIIHSHSCTFFGSYPFGINSIIRTIAHETKTDDKSAESILTMSLQGHLDGVHAQDEIAIIEGMSRAWIGEFKKLLKTSSIPDNLPHHVIISANSHEDFFVNSFKMSYPQTSLKSLTMEDVIKQVKFDTHAEQLRLTGLYAAAIHSL